MTFMIEIAVFVAFACVVVPLATFAVFFVTSERSERQAAAKAEADGRTRARASRRVA